MADTYTVQKGDTLWDIAKEFLGDPTKYTQLAALNDLSNPNLIYVGQTITLTGDGSSSSTSSSSGGTATIKQFGLQSNTDNTLFATWEWTRSNTENYEVEWCYDTGDSVWFVGTKSTTEEKQSTYSIPSNAKVVRFRVKPVSKTYTSNSKTTSYWTASWSTAQTYDTSQLPPKAPSTPSVKIEKYKLTAEVSDIDAADINATGVQFQVVKDDTTVFATGKASINTNTNYVSYSCTVTAGSEYKVRCRSYRGSTYSEWSNFSGNELTIPSVPSEISSIKASSETSVYLEWSKVASAKTYDIEYATKKDYFDKSDQTTVTSSIEFTYFEKSGLESGEEYFFRVRAVNDKGYSGWSEIKSIVIGTEPAAPTTWSSTTTVITGEELNLYWVHNSEDGSSQTYAELELYFNELKEVQTIKNSTDEDEKDKTSVYSINTKEYVEGTVIKWRVRTAGITKVYGDWSVERTIDVYAPPTLELSITDSNNNAIETLESFPFKVNALAGPNTQVPIGYHLTITSNEIYETVDPIGNAKTVNKGEQIYSKYFDINDKLSLELSAGDVDLENNVSYTITCLVSMNSGLTAESSVDITVSWVDNTFCPNAEISFDEDTIVTHIKPYCEEHILVRKKVTKTSLNYVPMYTVTDEVVTSVYGTIIDNVKTTTGEAVYSGVNAQGQELYFCETIEKKPITDVYLSVYRREFDGSFTELATGIDGAHSTFITDPHPALDYARYRVVAITKATGSVSYYDMPGYPIGEKSIIIQWDEEWSNFDATGEDALEQPAWSGSLLKLPYNIDVSDSHGSDVSLIEYIGRKHPVSYYGTQLGETSTWNTEIVKSDEETLYAIRRLAIWMGDVYVREPSGSGYWASVSVSFNQKHRSLTIPVTFNISRVEGGI